MGVPLLHVYPVKPAGNGRVGIGYTVNAAAADYGRQNSGPTGVVERVLVFEHVVRKVERAKEDSRRTARLCDGRNYHSCRRAVRSQRAEIADASHDCSAARDRSVA